MRTVLLHLPFSVLDNVEGRFDFLALLFNRDRGLILRIQDQLHSQSAQMNKHLLWPSVNHKFHTTTCGLTSNISTNTIPAINISATRTPKHPHGRRMAIPSQSSGKRRFQSRARDAILKPARRDDTGRIAVPTKQDGLHAPSKSRHHRACASGPRSPRPMWASTREDTELLRVVGETGPIQA
jgi:hypothetical protein